MNFEELSDSRKGFYKSLKKNIRKFGYTAKLNTCFDDVITQCASVKRNDFYTKENELNDDDQSANTWITDDMLAAYKRLHQEGYAHSIEIFVGMIDAYAL